MSWEFYTNRKVVARKEYSCDWQEHLEMSDIIYPAKKSIREPAKVNYVQCKEYGFSDEEIKTIEQYIADDFKIKKGELHSVTSGKTDGGFMIFRGNIAISDLMHKHELVNED